MDAKTCIKCDEEKVLLEFYPHEQMKDGHLNMCKTCSKREATKHRNDNLEKIRLMFLHKSLVQLVEDLEIPSLN